MLVKNTQGKEPNKELQCSKKYLGLKSLKKTQIKDFIQKLVIVFIMIFIK